MTQNYKITKYTCYLFYVLQGTLLNLTPLLFVPLMEQYGLSYMKLGALASVNFATQLIVDIVLSKLTDKHRYRISLRLSASAAFIGYMIFAWAPGRLGDPYTWLLIGTVVYSIGAGLMEITISPLIHALPDKAKGKSMAILHSFYAWGVVLTVIVSTSVLAIIGRDKWNFIVTGWLIVPVIGFILSCIMPVPKPESGENERTAGSFRILIKPAFILFLAMIFFGSCAEAVMTQWSSAFLERAVGLDKLIGDIAGMSMFALMLGLCRMASAALDKKISLSTYMMLGTIGAVICYIIVSVSNVAAVSLIFCALTGFMVGMLWPGTLVLAADAFPKAGAWLFAYLAVAGDLGGVFGPWITGAIADRSGLNAGLGAAAIFPVIGLICMIIYKRRTRSA